MEVAGDKALMLPIKNQHRIIFLGWWYSVKKTGAHQARKPKMHFPY
jgi:hypothetical protein